MFTCSYEFPGLYWTLSSWLAEVAKFVYASRTAPHILNEKAISRTIKTERDINLHSSSYHMRPQKQPPTIFLLDIFLKRFFISESEVYDPDSE